MAKFKAPKSAATQTSDASREGKVSWIERIQIFYLERKNLVAGSAVAVIVLVAVILGYRYIRGERNKQADELLGAIILEYEDGEYRTALDGSGDLLGLLDIINQYGGTRAGNTARFHAGNALFKLGEYDEALGYFEDFKAGDNIVGASAVAGRAAIHEVREEYERAGRLYLSAADMADNWITSPGYLVRAARAFTEIGEFRRAEESLEIVLEEYTDSDHEDEAEYRMGIVKARMN